MSFIPDCDVVRYYLLLIEIWTSLFIFFTTLNGCHLFLIVIWTSLLFFFFTTLVGCSLFRIPHLQHNVAWHGHPHPKQYTLSNAKDMLIADVSKLIVRGHNCPTAKIRNPAATPIPPSCGSVRHFTIYWLKFRMGFTI